MLNCFEIIYIDKSMWQNKILGSITFVIGELLFRLLKNEKKWFCLNVCFVYVLRRGSEIYNNNKVLKNY